MSKLIMDKNALTERIYEHYDYLIGFSKYLTRDFHDAQDLLYESIYKIIRNSHKIQDKSNIRAYFTQVIRNMYIDQYKKKKKRLHLNNEIDVNFDYSYNWRVEAVEKSDEGLNVEDLKNIIFSKFSNKSLRLICLLCNGYSYKEIAVKLKISKLTVRVMVFRIRKEMSQYICNETAADSLDPLVFEKYF